VEGWKKSIAPDEKISRSVISGAELFAIEARLPRVENPPSLRHNSEQLFIFSLCVIAFARSFIESKVIPLCGCLCAFLNRIMYTLNGRMTCVENPRVEKGGKKGTKSFMAFSLLYLSRLSIFLPLLSHRPP
jgi:hypothetical protein